MNVSSHQPAPVAHLVELGCLCGGCFKKKKIYVKLTIIITVELIGSFIYLACKKKEEVLFFFFFSKLSEILQSGARWACHATRGCFLTCVIKLVGLLFMCTGEKYFHPSDCRKKGFSK